MALLVTTVPAQRGSTPEATTGPPKAALRGAVPCERRGVAPPDPHPSGLTALSPPLRAEAPGPAPGSGLDVHRRFVWSLLYRLTGSAADADDLVQETFLRALERPPERIGSTDRSPPALRPAEPGSAPYADDPWRPWLVRVAMNLGRDHLRRRRRRSYVGPWLPSPVDTDDLIEAAAGSDPEAGAERRYDLRESASFAFLVALERLSPQQRAVLLLRDVLDYSVREAALALSLSEANVKTTHHRARRAMDAYDRRPGRLDPARAERTRAALLRFLGALASGDVAAVEGLLAGDARGTSDGGGVHFASRVVLLGAARVAKAYAGIARLAPRASGLEIRSINGLPGFVLEQATPTERTAPRVVTLCEVDDSGQITEVYTVLAPAKLTRIRPCSLRVAEAGPAPSHGSPTGLPRAEPGSVPIP